MKKKLIVSRVERLEEYLELANEYDVAFEINDFFDPAVLDDEQEKNRRIELYLQQGIPAESTMHGAFYDLVLFSMDQNVREIAQMRMRESMEIAGRLGVKGVVFHVNANPLLYSKDYDDSVVNGTVAYVGKLLEDYPDVEIYLENMFDDNPEILLRISEQLKGFKNYGICLDYAHAFLSETPVSQWIEALAPFVKHVHINDNDGKRDLHLAVGQGTISWGTFYEYAERYFGNCSLLIETSEPESQRKSLDYIDDKGWEKDPKEDSSAHGQAEELLEKIFHVMSRLTVENGLDTTVFHLTDLGRTLAGADRASFWYWDRVKKQYWTLAAWNSGRIVVEEGTGIVGATMESGETIVINNPYEDSRFNASVDQKTGYRTKSILSIPVKNSKGEVIGAYQAINKLGENERFEEIDVHRLSMAAVYCGRALESYLLYRDARVDAMTGLTNRRGFYEYYSERILNQKSDDTASIIMCDIDFFKKVNDVYGHNAGDAVLVQVSRRLQDLIEDKGEVVRWGGEEFVVLLPACAKTHAIELAESMRQQVEKKPFVFETQEIAVTMSFGVSTLHGELSPEENVKRADGRLYKAKMTGRNRVIWQD